jgi:hypothetical protein
MTIILSCRSMHIEPSWFNTLAIPTITLTQAMLASAPAAKQRRERRQERRARLERLAAANAAIQSSSHAVVAKRTASRLGTSAEGGDDGFLDAARGGDADGNGNDADADSAEHFDAAKQAADREDMEAELRELEAMERADMREEAQIQVRRL